MVTTVYISFPSREVLNSTSVSMQEYATWHDFTGEETIIFMFADMCALKIRKQQFVL